MRQQFLGKSALQNLSIVVTRLSRYMCVYVCVSRALLCVNVF